MTIAVDLGHKATKQTTTNLFIYQCCLLISLCIKFGPRSGLTYCQDWSGSKLFDTLTFFEKNDFEEKSADDKNPANYPSCNESNPLIVRLILNNFGRINMYEFVCETRSHAKSSLHWSVKHYQVTFEWHSGRGLETSFITPITGTRVRFFTSLVSEIRGIFLSPAFSKKSEGT